MININLVPVKEKKKQVELLAIFGIVGIVLIFILLMSGYYLQKKKKLIQLEEEIAQITEESKAYEEKIKEIKELEAKEVSLNSFKATIKSISEVQRKVTVAVDQLALSLPDGVWMTNLTQKTGTEASKFLIQGYSFSQLGLGKYLEAMQKPGGHLGEGVLEIRNINSSFGANKQIHQFEITAKVMEQSK